MDSSDATIINTAASTSASIVARIELDSRNTIAVYESSLPFTIGRDSECDLAIADGHISRHHCELSRISNVLYLKDTSANGTMIGDRLVNRESVSIDGNTSINLGGTMQISLTPLESADQRRSFPDRRDTERRLTTERRTNVVSVDFDRRASQRRDTEPRRSRSRRTATA